MARTKQTTGCWGVPMKNVRSSRQMNKFELTMRKYYPKKSRFLYKDLDYQASDADNYENANRRVFQRYKRSFFRSLEADTSPQTPQPSKIPNNLQRLKIIDGSTIFLKKLIKQNKGLKHIVIKSEDKSFNAKVIRYLKYSKSLRSITFKYFFPYFSNAMCHKMLRTWGKTLESFKSLRYVDFQYDDSGKSFKRVMETVLKLPKLRNLELKYSVQDAGEYFPFEKLQERNITYEVGFAAGRNTFESLKKNSPHFKPAGLVIVEILGGRLGDYFRQYSNQTLFLQRETNRDFKVFLLPVFQNIIALDISIIGTRWDLSNMGKLNSLKHLAINMIDDGDVDIFGDLFKYLNKNVAPHKKLETFMIRLCSIKDRKEDLEIESQGKAISKFFEAFSESLRKVHLEFEYPNDEFVDPENFCEGLSKLKNLKSLTLILDFKVLNSKKRVETICAKISEIKSLEKLRFRIRKDKYKYAEKILNLKFPPQLKSLSLGMNTEGVLFDASKTLWPLQNLTYLELNFESFSSQKWKNIIKSALDKLKLLAKFIITNNYESQDMKKG